MPLKPKTRPVGQQVVAAHIIHTKTPPKMTIPEGTNLTIEGIDIGADSKVRYKIQYNKMFVWVFAADLKTRK